MQIYTFSDLRRGINTLNEADIKKILNNKKKYIVFDKDTYGSLFPRFTNSDRNVGLFDIDDFKEAMKYHKNKGFLNV